MRTPTSTPPPVPRAVRLDSGTIRAAGGSGGDPPKSGGHSSASLKAMTIDGKGGWKEVVRGVNQPPNADVLAGGAARGGGPSILRVPHCPGCPHQLFQTVATYPSRFFDGFPLFCCLVPAWRR